MGASEVEAPNYTEIFESVCPYYMAIGMSYDQFWSDEPKLAVMYRRADEVRRRRMNEELWLGGIYMSDAIASTVGNMFSKQKYHYPEEPKPITKSEIEERKEREQRERMEKIKAAFTARALSLNAKKGGGEHDHF